MSSKKVQTKFQSSEIKKTEEINKDMETLKNNHSEINNSIFQINITIESDIYGKQNGTS
jgi:hypothetical protein